MARAHKAEGALQLALHLAQTIEEETQASQLLQGQSAQVVAENGEQPPRKKKKQRGEGCGLSAAGDSSLQLARQLLSHVFTGWCFFD